MKKLSFLFLSLFVFAFCFGMGVQASYATDYCPTSVSGWWGTFTPTNRQCPYSYYTYNNTSLGNEESWFLSNPLYTICGEATPPYGPTYYWDIESRAYIPSPDYDQTSDAHYYKWDYSGVSYLMIGNVDQYNTFGWASLSTTAWEYSDRWKISDWTDESLYSKRVDLDAFSISNCP